MSLAAFLYALFVQLNGSTLQGNAWTVEALRLTLANLHGIQNFFGIVALVSLAIIVVIVVLAFRRGDDWFDAIWESGCLGICAAICIAFWAIGWIHILAVGYLAANFTLAGATNPGFWIVLFLMISGCWS